MPPPRNTRIVIFLLDALRFDFLERGNKEYQNRLNTVHALMDQNPDNTQLWKFISDSPTTTSQRLKGLTCGSLPTFLDAGKNFDSDKLRADNWVSQLFSHNKSVILLGDDTWKNLFQVDKFARSRLYPAFNVHDLNTVDDGILRYFEKEMTGNRDVLKEVYQHDGEFGHANHFDKWDVIVAHFLGVDHAGHKHGVYHQKMYEKLDQMNQVLLNVSRLIDDDTILILMSDHGMLDNGNHGGDSEPEVESVLFAYSPGMKFSGKQGGNVPQIDFVPTISYLMGIPMPFGSLGRIIPEFVSLLGSSSVMDALRLNSAQLYRYISEYAKHDSSFNDLVSKTPQNQTMDEILQDIERISKKCRERWATFDVNGMILGICLFGLCIIAVALSTSNFEVIPMIIHVGYSISLFSNSFIVYEDRTVLFLLQTLFMGIYLNEKNFGTLIAVVLLKLSTSGMNLRMHGTHIIATKLPVFSFLAISISLLLIIVTSFRRNGRLSYALTCSSAIFVYWICQFKFDTTIYLIPRAIACIGIFYPLISPTSFRNSLFDAVIFIIVLLKGFDHVFEIAMLVWILQYFDSLPKTMNIALIGHYLTTFYFFALGQQNTFNTINWNAAFVFNHEMNDLSGVFIVMGVFASQILTSLYFDYDIKHTLLIKSLPMLTTMILVFVERRHLMVWSIFAPKYIFSVLSFAVDITLRLIKVNIPLPHRQSTQ